eukprot:CAMPEP_0177579620 /NCGR_PEP_ID=MMETSP0419_2-20121207/1066_1 /TAXON_ID=582737 /ORGANISM="Tetraselmis sp., Strain GSL018" /LENGTH=263 /DNA_ID=CAMNT_0019068317 /DNA_START=141 /DNA_END=929 /DNA_ORIENTATION=-
MGDAEDGFAISEATLTELKSLLVIFKRKLFKPGRGKEALLRKSDDPVEQLGLQIRSAFLRKGKPADAKVLEDEQRRRDADRLEGHRTVRHHRAARPEELGDRGGTLAANAVETQRGLPPRARCLGLLGPDDGRGADGREALCDVVPVRPVADNIQSFDAPRCGDLDNSLANGTVGTILDDDGALFEVDEPLEEAERGWRVDGEAGGGELRETLGDAVEARGREGGERAPRPEHRVEGHDSVSRRQVGGAHLGAKSLYDADALH